ncbi:Nucleosome assembly protein (NAP) [Corchorus capsularis]|uniref:Nucleosome assembly protein (NAP) n=1 Tax=Corchorus capsularis TaxID=210143 RepID=A0A1R3FUE4_COCAP|nr:Nucleosome assembly protein (NAP) [Corchorus capsularis]
MVADKAKKIKVGDKAEEENSEQIDGDLVLSIEKLQEVQDELEKINEEASEKVLEVEQKYNEVRKPVYDKRNDIIKSIPDFWLTAFLSHPALSELLTDEDHKIFKHISSLEVEDFKDLKSGYSITFNFSPNPYFEDTKLTKTFTFLDEGTKITATKIKWKEGMGLPNGVNHEKKGNKRQLPQESFFAWFTDAQQKDEMDEIHDEVAEIIKEDLWPNPLTYFNNEADEEEFDGEGDEGKDDDDSDDEDEDDDEDDDDDDGDDDN